jgi:DNA-3-methyladenine glycosylase II
MAEPPTPERIAELRRELARRDPALARVDAQTPAFEWRVRQGGYQGLMHILVAQQVSTAAADAIWSKLEAGLGGVSAERVARSDLEALRALGLSKPKARYALEIARAELDGGIDFAAVSRLDEDAAMAALTGLIGVGRWTAEIYLMFCDGRLDFFPAGDLALQEALRRADGLAVRPDEKAARLRAEAWAPHRGTAAHLLWRWYRAQRQGEINPSSTMRSGEAV